MKKSVILFLLILASTISLFGNVPIENDAIYISASPIQKPTRFFDVNDYITPKEKSQKSEIIETSQSVEVAQLNENPSSVATINDYDFIYAYYKTIESSLNRNRKTGKLGKKTIEGLKSGFFHYRSRLSGWNKVTVTMVYENYADFDYVLNGTTIVSVNWGADGIMKGTIYTDGPAKATIEYNLILENGIENSGSYLIDRPENDYKMSIPSSVIFGFADRDIEFDERCTAERNDNPS